MTGEAGVPRLPRGLAAAGRATWRAIVGAFELDAGELEILEQACRVRDVIADLEAVVAAEGRMTVGSMGQPVLHPGVAEVRAQRDQFARLWRLLDLPDGGQGEAGESAPVAVGSVVVGSAAARSLRARRAANARWGRRGAGAA